MNLPSGNEKCMAGRGYVRALGVLSRGREFMGGPGGESPDLRGTYGAKQPACVTRHNPVTLTRSARINPAGVREIFAFREMKSGQKNTGSCPEKYQEKNATNHAEFRPRSPRRYTPKNIRVPVVPRVLLDQMNEHPPQTDVASASVGQVRSNSAPPAFEERGSGGRPPGTGSKGAAPPGDGTGRGGGGEERGPQPQLASTARRAPATSTLRPFSSSAVPRAVRAARTASSVASGP